MKKLIAVFAAIALFAGIAVFAQPDTKTSSDGIFEYTDNGVITAYYGVENVYVPAEIDGTKIREIGVMAFLDLDISTLYIENGIEEINTNAFEGSNLLYADLPASVKTIGERAFLNCAKLVEVTLNSEETELDDAAFFGTGFIQFNLPCTADEERMRQKISAAKGDDQFDFHKIHMSLTESMTEKDVFGENMIYCEDCGFRGSKYLEDTALPFEDVPEDAWYSQYITIAYRYGILNGKSETQFDPDAGMTCAEAVKIAACIHESQTEDPINPDGEVFDAWYDPYFQYCYNAGIIEN